MATGKTTTFSFRIEHGLKEALHAPPSRNTAVSPTYWK